MFEAISILRGDIPKGTEGRVLIDGHLVSLGVPLMPCDEDGATSLRVTVVNPDVYSGFVRTVSALTTWAIAQARQLPQSRSMRCRTRSGTSTTS